MQKFYLFSILSFQIFNINSFDRFQLAGPKPISSLVKETYTRSCFNGDLNGPINTSGSCGTVFPVENTSIKHNGDHLSTMHYAYHSEGLSKESALGARLSSLVRTKFGRDQLTSQLVGTKLQADASTSCVIDRVDTLMPGALLRCSTKIENDELHGLYKVHLQRKVAKLPEPQEFELNTTNLDARSVTTDYATLCAARGQPVNKYGSCGSVKLDGMTIEAKLGLHEGETKLVSTFQTPGFLGNAFKKHEKTSFILSSPSWETHRQVSFGLRSNALEEFDARKDCVPCCGYDKNKFNLGTSTSCRIVREPSLLRSALIECTSRVKTADLLREHGNLIKYGRGSDYLQRATINTILNRR